MTGSENPLPVSCKSAQAIDAARRGTLHISRPVQPRVPAALAHARYAADAAHPCRRIAIAPGPPHYCRPNRSDTAVHASAAFTRAARISERISSTISACPLSASSQRE